MDGRVFLALLVAGAALAQPPITLFEPNGGQTYHVGGTMRIRWTADSSSALVDIEMCVDGDESGVWYRINTQAIGLGGPGWGDTTWVIADSLHDATTTVSTVSSRCLVRIRNYIDQVTEDRSDSVFAVLGEQVSTPEPDDTDSDCGCGSGAGAALLPPITLKALRRRRRAPPA